MIQAKLQETKTLRINYRPMEHQQKARRLCKESEIFVLVCGTGWGKTYWLIGQMLEFCFSEGQNWKEREPYMGIVVAPTNKSLRLIHLPIINMFGEQVIADFNKSDLVYTLVNGSQIILMSAENPDRMRGLRPNVVGLDEMREYGKDVYEIAYNRLSFRKGRLFGATTPFGYDWTHDIENLSFEDPSVNAIFGRPSTDNPLFDPKRIEKDALRMDPDFHAQEFFAKRVKSGRTIYKFFDRNTHVKFCPMDEELPFIFCMDFNVCPMSTAVLQPHGKEYWQVDEIVIDASSVGEMCAEINERYGKYIDTVQKQIKNFSFYPDPSGIARQHGGYSSIQIIEDYFIAKYKAHVDINHRNRTPYQDDRINAMNALLKNAKDKSRYFIDPKCKHTIQSFERTEWKEGTRQIDKTASVEHLTDGIGYFAEYEYPIAVSKVA